MAWGLSAGRVQSVAVRLLVQRERARRAFRSGSYWDLKAQLEHAGSGFEAKLTHVSGRRIASGNDFDESTGGLKAGSEVRLLTEEEARGLAATVQTAAWSVDAVERSQRCESRCLRSPPARCSRRRTASCASRRGRRCAAPRASTNAVSSPTCEPIRFIFLIRRSAPLAAVWRASTARSI